MCAQHNRGFLPGIILLLIQCYYHRGNPFKCHEEALYLQPMIPPKRVDMFPPDWGMLKRSRCVQIFLQTATIILLLNYYYCTLRVAHSVVSAQLT